METKINKAFLIFTGLLFSVQAIMAQHHEMSSMQKKNTFLTMMDTMMKEMDNAPLPGTFEADFMSQMIPHHQGAIDMATYQVKHGKNFEMIQLAKSILTEQSNEIVLMNLWLNQPFEISSKSNKDFTTEINKTMTVMMENMPLNDKLNNVDKSFAMVMVPHHQAAIDMAKVLLKFSKDPKSISFANHLISSEQIEIEQMNAFIKH